MTAWPTVTLIIPVLDDVQNLRRCLSSISSQDYPTDRLEVLVADGGSRDGSRDLANHFADHLKLRIIDNSSKTEAEWGKAVALRETKGELFECIDADMWLPSRSMLRTLAKPLLEDAELAGTIAPYQYERSTSVWSRYLSLDPFQRDPLLEFITPNIQSFIRNQRPSYTVCEFTSPRIPPIGGTTMFRSSEVNLDRWGGHFREVDHPAYLVKNGRNLFALVRSVGWAHDHCRSLVELVRKRRRNLSGLGTSFLHQDTRDYVWWDGNNQRERLLLLRWVLGTNLLVPRVAEGIADAIRTRKWEALLRPLAALAITDALLIDLLRSPRGRDFLRNSFSQLSNGD
jgi:glycosyltransferase involved in cell wall biosynthesis